jgi:hypothetical protein
MNPSLGPSKKLELAYERKIGLLAKLVEVIHVLALDPQKRSILTQQLLIRLSSISPSKS